MTGRERRATILIAMLAFSLMMVFAGPLSAAPLISAQTMASSNTGTSSSTMENMVLNLGTPLYIEHDITINTTNITQSITNTTFEGNGTFMLPTPTGGGNVSTTDSGYSITTTIGGLMKSEGKVLIKTTDGKESAVANFAVLRPINSTTMAAAIGIAYIQTNSTVGQQLAPLNNTLGVFKNEEISPTQSTVTFWKWNPVTSPPPQQQQQQMMKTTNRTTSTTATTTTRMPSSQSPSSSSLSSPSNSESERGSSSSNSAHAATTTTTTHKQLAITINIAKDPIVRGNEQEITVTATDATTHQEVGNAHISAEVVYASGSTTKHFDGVTGSSDGQYSFSWRIGGNSSPGTFQVHIDASASGYEDAGKSGSFEVTRAS